MKKQFFARLIELVHHQVLIMKVDTDHETAKFGVRIETDIYDHEEERYKRVGANFGFDTPEAQHDAYISFDMARSQEIVVKFITQMEVENPYLADPEKPESSIIL